VKSELPGKKRAQFIFASKPSYNVKRKSDEIATPRSSFSSHSRQVTIKLISSLFIPFTRVTWNVSFGNSEQISRE